MAFWRRKERTEEPLREPPERPSADRPGELPPDGPATVAGIALPSGARVRTDHDPPHVDVLWRTGEAPPDAARLWADLAHAFPETGLWPVLLEQTDHHMDLDRAEDWEEIAARDPEAVFRKAWADSMPIEPDDEDEQEFIAEVLAPVGTTFPGLGRGDHEDREPGCVSATAKAMNGIAAVALVPVTRPADVPAAIGWTGPVNAYRDTAEVSAVLRSWEERYDAILVGLGFDTLYLAVRRPPRDDEVVKAAAEIYAFNSDLVTQGLGTMKALIKSLERVCVWNFWWD